MADGEREGGWRPPNDDRDDERRDSTESGAEFESSWPRPAEDAPKGGLWSSGDPLASGGWEPPSGSGGSAQGPAPQSGWEPPSGGGWPPPQQPQGWGPPQQSQGWGPPASSSSGSNGKATAALILGIVGIFVCPIICSVLALVFGYQARGEIDRSGRRDNRGMATAGIVLGWIGIVLGFLGAALIIGGILSADDMTFEESEPVGDPAILLIARVLLALPAL